MGEGEGTITTTMPGTGTDTQWLRAKTTNTTTYTITMKMTVVTIMTRMPFDPDGMDLFIRPYLYRHCDLIHFVHIDDDNVFF